MTGATTMDRDEMVEAAAQALADDVWHPPIHLDKMSAHEASRFRRQARLVVAALRAQAECNERQDEDYIDAIEATRRWTKEGLNFNCTFVDDEMRLLVGLAQRAVLAGLAADANPRTLERFMEASEKHRADHEAALGFALRSPPMNADAVDAARYRRLRILGCAPGETAQLKAGTVLRFTNLDAHLDADIQTTPSRGEFSREASGDAA